MKNIKFTRTHLIFVGIALIILVLLIRIITGLFHDTSNIDRTVKQLKEMEKEDISEIENTLREQDANAAKQNTPAATDTKNPTAAEEFPEYTTAELRQHYQGAVIMGDSITNSIYEYEILGRDVVVSKIGLSVANADEEIQTAIELNPHTIIMCFGANDLETYEENVDQFITAYTKQIKKLQAALPNTKIYINGILPIKESRIETTPALQYYPQYNEKLQQMCKDLGLTYIDSSSIITSDPSLYEPDGEHLVYAFYGKWLTYMATKAGL